MIIDFKNLIINDLMKWIKCHPTKERVNLTELFFIIDENLKDCKDKLFFIILNLIRRFFLFCCAI